MRKLIAAALIAGSAIASAACGAKAERDPGPMSAKDFKVADFKSIESAGSYDVIVRTGAAPSVRAEGPQNVIDRLEIKVDGDELHIRPKDGGNFQWGRSAPIKILVTVPQLQAATIAGSGTISVDKVAGDSFKAAIAGSGDLSVPQMKVKSVEFEIAGSGSASIAGETETADYTIAGSGELDASRLKSRDVKLTIAGSGAVQANASGEVKGEILGSGEARVTGGAKCAVEKLGSGSIVCA